MSNASDYLENKILNDYFGSGKPSYVALYQNGAPGDAGTTNPEVTGGTYARKAATWNINGSTASLAAAIVWSGMPACKVGGWAVFDAASGGNMLVQAPFTATKDVAAGDAFSTDVGALTITAD